MKSLVCSDSNWFQSISTSKYWLMKLNLTHVRLYIRGHRSESVLWSSSKLHKPAQKTESLTPHVYGFSRQTAPWRRIRTNVGAKRLDSVSSYRNMCRSLISSGTQNMYRDERWSNTSHDGGPDGKISPSDGSVSTIEGEKQRQSVTWSRHRPVDQEVWRINEVQMFKCPEEKTKALLGSVQIDLKE